jgi:hypothetical protein
MALINTTTTGVLGSTFVADGTGDLTIQQNGVTINKVTANPACRVYMSDAGGSNRNVTSGTWTKIPFDTAEYNILNCFDLTNNRFRPTVAGYYQVNGNAQLGTNTSSGGYFYIAWYKNGSVFNYASSIRLISATVASDTMLSASNLVYLNGTTDYLELAVYIEGSSPSIGTGPLRANFSAFLARAA